MLLATHIKDMSFEEQVEGFAKLNELFKQQH
jgi:hypothetical protein